MNDDIREILEQLERAYTNSHCIEREKAKRYYDAINNLIHNWNELKKWLEERYLRVDSGTDFEIALHMTLDKMQELEEGGNND